MIIGGAQENTLLNCLDLVRDYGDDVLLITGPSLGPEGDLLSQGRAGELPIRLLPNLRRSIHPWRDVAAYRAIRRALREFNPDVVHTHSAKGGLLGRHVCLESGRSRRGPFGSWCTVSSLSVERSTAVLLPMRTVGGQTLPSNDFGGRCHDRSDGRSQSGAAGEIHHDLQRHGRRTIPVGGRASCRHASRVRDSEEHVVVGKIARLFHLKGHDDLITAAASVVEANPLVRFLLVGDGILRAALEKKIAMLGLGEHFIFTGLVPPSEVPPLIGAMDVLVHTSYREGLARALPQALIAGRPVVSYDVDGAREVTITGETGILVPPRDTAALADAMSTLVGDADLRSQLGREGQRRFTDQFRHQTMTRQIRQLYEQVLARENG